MARPEKVFARSGHSQHIYPLSLMAGEVRVLSVDWNQILGDTGTTISSACAENDGSIGISAPTVSGGVTSFTATASSSGVSLVTQCVTMVNGEKYSRSWRIVATDPLYSLSDYQS